MKRVIFALAATVVGVVAMLSFQTQGSSHSAGGVSSLPSAALPSVAESTQPAAVAPVSTSAPPDPSPSGGASSPAATSAASATTSFVGSAVTTRYGIIQVKVTVAARRITNVSFVQLTA